MRLARLALAASLLAAVPAVAGPAGTACAQEGRGEIEVAVVVDFGPLSDVPPSQVCVTIPEGADGSAVLEARAELLGTPAPRYDSSGLLCAIDGLPETGCGEPTEGGGYRYWSYWQGTAEGWEHSQVGPAFRDAEASVTEGWHFVEGSGRPTDPPPRAEADPAAVCEAAARAGPTETAGADDDGTGGALWGTIAAAAAVLVLVGAGLLLARRRSRE